MADMLQDQITQIIDRYYQEQNLHQANKDQIAADRDFAKSKAKQELDREIGRIQSLQQSAEAMRERKVQELEAALQQQILTARQAMTKKTSAVNNRRHELEMLKKKMPSEFQNVTPASLSDLQTPITEERYQDLLNTMYAYEDAPLLKRASMKQRATTAAAVFLAMIQSEELNIARTENVARTGIDLSALQEQHKLDVENALRSIPTYEDEVVDRSKYDEALKQADRIYEERMSAEEERHAAQPTFEDRRRECEELIDAQLDALHIDAADLALPYESPPQSQLENALFSIVLDAKGFNLRMPYVSSWEHPEHLWLYIDDEDVQERALDGFRSIVCENLRLLPFGSLRVYWLDPSQQGMSTREPAMLADDLPLCGAVVKRATTGSQVTELLAEVEELQAQIGEKIAAYRGGIREYNKLNPNDQIPYTMIVVNDITHPAFERRAVDLLSLRMRNASRMGMQALVLSDAYEIGSREDEILDSMREQFFRTVAEVQGGELFAQQASGELAQVEMLDHRYAEPAFIQSFVDACEELAKRPAPEPEPQRNLDEVEVYPASEGIEIPIGFFANGDVASLKFGSVVGGSYAEHTHGIITGGTGSGKTTFVRNLIQSVCSHYSPAELELWLVDYKAEMSSFCNMGHRFPHFGLIGLDRSMDFVAGFMNYLEKEYERRSRIISEPSSRGELKRDDISDYNEWAIANGRETLPRLLVIVDEFHVQSNYMRQVPEWRTTFENLLREVRSRGINILLVDQDINGLVGLTDSGQAQLSLRATLGVNAGHAQDLRSLFGTADNATESISMAASMKHQALVFDKSSNMVQLVTQLRDCDWGSIANAVTATTERFAGQRHDTKIYNVHDVEGLALEDIVPTAEGLYPIGGIPDFIKPQFELQLRNRSRQNIFAMGTAEPLLPFNVVSLMAYTAWKSYGYRVVLLGVESCDIFDETYDAWEELNEEYMDDEMEIYEGVGEINRFFDGFDELTHTFVVIVGFDELDAEMAELPPRPATQSASASAASSTGSRTAASERDARNKRMEGLIAFFNGDEDDGDDAGEELAKPTSAPITRRSDAEHVNDMPTVYKLLTLSKEADVHVAVLDDSFPNLIKIFRDERRRDFDKLFPHAFATKPAALADGFDVAMKNMARSLEDSEIDKKIVYSDPNRKVKSVAVYDVPWNESLRG